MKPRKLSSLIRAVLQADPRANINRSGKQLNVQFFSMTAYTFLRDNFEVRVIAEGHLSRGKDIPKAFILWDVESLKEPPVEYVQAYRFEDEAKRERDRVTEQEEEVADVYGGERHVGSGAIDGLKSDSSGKGFGAWQVENKSTKAMSFPMKVSILDKITREARVQGKHPMLQVRFVGSPEWSIAEDDWFVIPKSAFEKKMRKDDE